ncbi:MAG TPA: hypothetical protein VEV44_03870 [Pseudoneobacillus sp.]|nr:hypothetical protein [Pseudoneobacillus sp.]
MREQGYKLSKKSDNYVENIPYLDTSKNTLTQAYGGGSPYLNTSEDSSIQANNVYLDTSED